MNETEKQILVATAKVAGVIVMVLILYTVLPGCGAIGKDTTETVMNAPCRQYCEASCGVGPPYFAGCGVRYDPYISANCAECGCFKLGWTLPDWVDTIDDSWCYAFVPSSE